IRDFHVTGVQTCALPISYKVSGDLAEDVLTGVVPGVNTGAEVTFWLRADDEPLPVRATAVLNDDASVDITLSDVNKPVTVEPPEIGRASCRGSERRGVVG